DPLDVPLRPRKSVRRFFRQKAGRREQKARLERVLSAGNFVFRMILQVERNWRDEVLERKTLYDPKDEKDIVAFFQQWAIPCGRCEQEIARLARRSHDVVGADEFRRNCAYSERVLKEGLPTFENAEIERRWRMLTEFMRPQPRAVYVDEGGRVFDASGT